MYSIAKKLKVISAESRISFAKDMILNSWCELTVREVNLFSRYIRMFDKQAT